MIPLGFGFNENQRHQNCISQDASVTGFKRKVRNPGPEDHIRLHFFEPGLRTFLTYSTISNYFSRFLLVKNEIVLSPKVKNVYSPSFDKYAV